MSDPFVTTLVLLLLYYCCSTVNIRQKKSFGPNRITVQYMRAEGLLIPLLLLFVLVSVPIIVYSSSIVS